MTVKAAIQLTTTATSIALSESILNTPVKTRITQNTPTFTTATACNKAETGVGATIALGSHEWNGISPFLANPNVKARRTINPAVESISVQKDSHQ